MRFFWLVFLCVHGVAGVCFAGNEPLNGVLVKEKLKQVADWQMGCFDYALSGGPGHLHDHGIDAWTNAVLYMGMAEWAKIAGDTTYVQWLYRIGEKSQWRLAENFADHPKYGLYHADEFCMGQFYLRMHALFAEERMLAAVEDRLDGVLARPPLPGMDAGNKQVWSWCDALFMAPAVYARLALLTRKEAYLAFMDEQFKKSYNHLYDREERLFFRDDRFFEQREKNGRKVCWGRGNGWVAAGLVEILKSLPEESPYRPFYAELFREFVPRLVALQDKSGFWHASLLDPGSYPSPETSATALITYALAYGIGEGLLERDLYFPALERSWGALCSAVSPAGKLGWVQPIGADPKTVTQEMTAVYGVGAFLLAGSELHHLLTATPRKRIPFNEHWSFKKAESLPQTLHDTWEPVRIPHTWNATDMQVKKNSFYAGTAFYRKTFVAAAAWSGKRVFIRFEGVASVAEVYVNGTLAGNHKGGYSAFALEIGSLLHYGGKNEIMVKVDNDSRPDVIPINHTLFGVYGGIYRPVELILTEKVNIAVTDYASPGVYISQRDVTRQSADVGVRVKLENRHREAKQVRVRTTVYEADGKVKARQEMPVTVSPQGGLSCELHFRMKNPRLWQGLEDPYLYRVVTRVESGGVILDEVVQSLGIRHFELRTADGLYLNGKKVPMYGVCRHQDWWEHGSALTNEQHDTDLEIIREMGATTIRFAHYQQAERIYQKCDSIGFIVWAEIPFVNRVSTREADNAKQQLTELIRQNYNHPSIYVWGLHNEVYKPHEYTAQLTAELHDLAKSEDPDRYTVSVNGYSTVDHPVNLRADIQGINRYYGWYEGKIGDLVRWVDYMKQDFPTYKLMLAEYGAEANIDQQEEQPGETGRYFSQFYPETFSTRFHEVQWGIISRSSILLASYLWNTFDFATPVNTQGGVEARNMKGLVTFDRKVKKDPYYWYKANWSREPVLYLTQRRLTERKNRVTPVTVYSNVGTPQLFVNGKEITEVSKGETAVHYIFNPVTLSDGRNHIVVRARHNGQWVEDEVVWNYTPDNASKGDLSSPELKTKEHGGL